jgi:hypothetical protein
MRWTAFVAWSIRVVVRWPRRLFGPLARSSRGPAGTSTTLGDSRSRARMRAHQTGERIFQQRSQVLTTVPVQSLSA